MSANVDVLAELLDRWEVRSRGALPADAMLINRHARELREVSGAVINRQDEAGKAAARFAVEKAEFRRLAVALAECVEIVHDAEKDWRSEGHMGMPDSVFARLADVLERSRELGVLDVYERCAREMESLINDAADMALDEMTIAALGTARDVLRERASAAGLIEAMRKAKFQRVDYDTGPAMLEITEDDLMRISAALGRIGGTP